MESKFLEAQSFVNEKLAVIELVGRKALFSNDRIKPEKVPQGLYRYDLRYSDEENRFIAIEPKVGVNHGGTVLMKEPLDFSKKGYLSLTDDTSPNFLSEDMTPKEFTQMKLDEEKSMQEEMSESQETGSIQMSGMNGM